MEATVEATDLSRVEMAVRVTLLSSRAGCIILGLKTAYRMLLPEDGEAIFPAEHPEPSTVCITPQPHSSACNSAHLPLSDAPSERHNAQRQPPRLAFEKT